MNVEGILFAVFTACSALHKGCIFLIQHIVASCSTKIHYNIQIFF